MKNRSIDKILLGALGVLVVFGLMMIASAGVVYSETRFDDAYFFLKRQLLYGVFPGAILFYFFLKFDYKKLKKFSLPLFIVSLITLILVLIPGLGTTAYGATRWLQLGPLSFQPSEMVKLAVIIYLAAWLSSRGKKNVSSFYEGFVPFAGIMGVISFLIYKQPDVGTLGLIALISLAIFFVAGATVTHIVAFVVAGLGVLFGIIKSASYRWDRFMVFLNPELDPQGKGYQISQALLAIGSGGILGLGLGQSRQKFNYLPEPVGDSIFAIVGEELGLLGAMAVIIVFMVMAYRGYRIASRAVDEFGRLLAVGITSWIIFQALINSAAIIGLIPLTGMPLPFISYGGTSLVFSLAAMGILLNIGKQSKM